jgi:hypothetical protein
VGNGPNGRALITAQVEPGDTFTVNGAPVPAYMGADAVDELPVGRWMPFINSGSQLDFRGGGAGLAVRVVGGTVQPSNPRENTLWVNTSMPITQWAIRPNPPTGVAGAVWIRYGLITESDRHLYIVDKNQTQRALVWPNGVFQYVSGAWVDLTANSRLYQTNAWRQITTYLFDAGTQNVPWSLAQTVNSSAGNMSGVIQGGTISLSAQRVGSQSVNPGAYFATAELVNVAGTSSLRANVTVTNAAYGYIRMALTNSRTPLDPQYGRPDNVAVAFVNIQSSGQIAIDTSGLSGAFYIGFSASSTSALAASTLSVSNVWLV